MRLPALLAALTLPCVVGAQEGTWALTNARIETVARGVIERGTIVIRDGLIEAVGPDVRPPADARIVDLAGKYVFPGLIDLTSTLGLPSAPAGGGQGGQQGGAAQGSATPVRNVGLEPGRVIADELRPSASDIRTARDVGITTVLVAPSRGAFRGLSALVPLREESATRYIVKSPVALHMGFEGAQGSGFGGRYPASSRTSGSRSTTRATTRRSRSAIAPERGARCGHRTMRTSMPWCPWYVVRFPRSSPPIGRTRFAGRCALAMSST
jgi:hypothetical protein